MNWVPAHSLTTAANAPQATWQAGHVSTTEKRRAREKASASVSSASIKATKALLVRSRANARTAGIAGRGWRVQDAQGDQVGERFENVLAGIVRGIVHERYVYILRDGLHGDARQRARQRRAVVVKRNDYINPCVTAQRLVKIAGRRLLYHFTPFSTAINSMAQAVRWHKRCGQRGARIAPLCF